MGERVEEAQRVPGGSVENSVIRSYVGSEF